MMRGLTQKQQACLAYVSSYWTERGVSPSYQEIADRLGIQARSCAHGLVSELVALGFLVRAPGKKRGIAPTNVSAITVLLPAAMEARLRIAAERLGISSEAYVLDMLKDRLVVEPVRKLALV